MMMNYGPYSAAQASFKNNKEKEKKTSDHEVTETVDRVYKKYGNDLSAFYRDIKKSINMEKSDDRPKRRASD